MSMPSAPYPDLVNPTMAEVVSQTRGYFVKFGERTRGLIPSWYSEHVDPDQITVRSDGLPLLAECDRKPFMVSEVPIERRWAINSSGDLMSRSDFRDLYTRLEDETVMALKADNPDSKAETPVVAGTEIPNLVKWVSVTPDPDRPWMFLPMHYDPDHTRGAKPTRLGDSGDDEQDVDRMESLVSAYNDPKGRMAMRPTEVEEVERHLRSSPSPQDDVLGTVKLLTEQLSEGVITQDYYNMKLADLSSVNLAPEDQGTRVAPPQEAEPFVTTAPCGREFKTKTERGGKGALRSHKRACKECRMAGEPSGYSQPGKFEQVEGSVEGAE